MRAVVCGVVAGVVALSMAAVPAGSVSVPASGATYYAQTNGSNAAVGLGDYYTAAGAGNTNHVLRLDVPCGWPAGTPLMVDLYGAEMTTHSSVNGLSDEPAGSASDGSEFVLSAPGGATEATQVFAPTTAPEQWVRLVTIPDAAARCGTWSLTSRLLGESNDQNGWRLRVGLDDDSDPTSSPANSSDPDGQPGTGDELSVGLERITYQHDAGAVVCQTFWTYVAPGRSSVRFHNFDMDGNGRVRYYAPGSAIDPLASSGGVLGTTSVNAAWNNGGTTTTRVGDLVTVTAPGWWAVVSCISNHNQLIQEGASDGTGPGGPLYMERPPTPVIEVTKDDGATEVDAGGGGTWTITARNTSNTTSTPGAASAVEIDDTAPGGTTFTSCAWRAPATGTCAVSGGTSLSASLDGFLAAGSAAQLDVAYAVDPSVATATALINTATATFEDSFGRPMPPVSGSDTSRVVRPSDPWVTVTIDPPYDLDEDSAISYGLGNGGVEPSADTQVTGTVPAGFTPSGFDPLPHWSCTISGATWTCVRDEPLPSGAGETLRMTGRVTGGAGDVADFPATISTSTLERDTTNNADQDSATPRAISVATSAVCVADVPWLGYTVTAVGFTPQPDDRADLVWRRLDGTIVRTDSDQPLSGRVLWPGAAVDGTGQPTDWPGWDLVAGRWVEVDDGLRPQLRLTVLVNPDAVVTVTYPAATAGCAAEPPQISTTAPLVPPTAGRAAPTIAPPTSPSARPVQPTATSVPLAATGHDASATLTFGLLLLVSGAVMTRVARRRPGS